MTDAIPRSKLQYTPYQLEFINRLVAEVAPGSIHLLLAPVGSGKSAALAGSIVELSQAHPLFRTIVLCPAALVAQWGHFLEGGDIYSVIIEGRGLRLLREQLGDTPDDWPKGVYSMSIDLAKRPDDREFILGVPWDLVVVDEAHLLSGQRSELVEGFLAKENPPSLVLATHTQSEGTQAFTTRATLIDWSEAFSEFLSEVKAQGRPVPVIRKYRRSDEEIEIAGQVLNFARSLGQFKGMAVLQRAASSISGLEGSLFRCVEKPSGDVNQVGALEELLQQVEELHVDSKLECFKGLLDELIGAGSRHIVAFCEYRATLDYLAAAVERRDLDVSGLHGGMADSQRREAIAQFEAEGGLLITTSVALLGLELRSIDAAIHYDLPTSPTKFSLREGRYDRYGLTKPCTVYFLEDETGALPLEGMLLRMALQSDVLNGEENVDLGEVFQSVVK